MLERHGCHRLQKSVFVAPDMAKKDQLRLEVALFRIFQRRPLESSDHLHWFPLSEELAAQTRYAGHNNVFTEILAQKKVLVL